MIIRSEFAEDADMKQVLSEFVQQLPEQVGRLLGLLRQGDLEELRRAVHQLKGAGGGYGFPMVTQLAAATEDRIKATDPLDVIANQVHELMELIRKIDGYDRAREPNHVTENTGH